MYFILRVLLFQFALTNAVWPAEKYFGYSDYQIITDRSFRADRYFQRVAQHGVNFQRMWVTGYSNAARDVDELMPFSRRGNQYRLSAINPKYLKRLKEVMDQARAHNQRVMLTLFDHWSLARVFPKTPWYYKNNHERLLDRPFPNFYSVDDTKLNRIQENLVREIVRSTKHFNPIYEVMNEAAGADCARISVWHEKVASWILDEFPEAEIAVNLMQECAEVLNAGWVSIISFHQNVWDKRGICESIENYPEKHVIIDTDGAWEVRDDNALVKTWLDETLRCGGSFNHKDNIYKLDSEFLQLYREARRIQRNDAITE